MFEPQTWCVALERLRTVRTVGRTGRRVGLRLQRALRLFERQLACNGDIQIDAQIDTDHHRRASGPTSRRRRRTARLLQQVDGRTDAGRVAQHRVRIGEARDGRAQVQVLHFRRPAEGWKNNNKKWSSNCKKKELFLFDFEPHRKTGAGPWASRCASNLSSHWKIKFVMKR